jgi:peptidyl-dipeptidase A
MLAVGASRPWPEALAMLGEQKLDATAIQDYFAPLQTWLEKENQGQKCGWKAN